MDPSQTAQSVNECEIFMTALDIESPDERSAFLDRACGGSAALRQRVDALLQHHAQGDEFLETPAVSLQDATGTIEDSAAAESASAPLSHSDRTEVFLEEQLCLDFLARSDDPTALGCLGQYTVTEVIGRGGMGIVLKARDTSLNRVVAIKVLAPELAGNATARKRFLREARAAAAIRDDHVVTIYAVHDGRHVMPSALAPQPPALPHLVMEFIDGQSLQQKIDSAGPLELKETLRIGAQVAAGLAAAHAHGVIHRDIKPSNILLENGVERVRITDFGLARAVDDVEITRTGEVAGTPQYMSPEQAQGQPVDARSDLFSFGCVLYAMCTGRSPFRAESTIAAIRRVCDDTPRPIREVNAETPDRLTQIIDRLLAKRPEERFQTAQEVADLLGQHLAHVQHPGSVPRPVMLPSLPRGKGPGVRGRAMPNWVAAALLLLAVLGILGVTEATGVTHLAGTVVRIVTGEGTLIIEIDDPSVQVSLDGEELTISGGGVEQVRLRPGQYQFTAMKDGRPVKQELVTITRGGEKVVTVSREAVPVGDLPVSNGELRRFPAHGGRVLSVAVSRSGRLLSVNGDGHEDGQFIKAPDYTLLLRDIASGDFLTRIPHEGEVYCGVASRDGDRAVTVCAAGPVRLWDLAAGRELQRCGDSAGYAAALSQDGRYVACLDNAIPGTGQSLRVWDVAQERVVKVFPWSDADTPVADGVEPVIWTLAFSPDGSRVAAGGAYYRDGERRPEYAIRIWDVESGQELPRLSGHTDQVKSIVFSRDGRRLLSGSFDSTIRLWDVTSAQSLRIVGKHTGLVECVDLSADGRRALSAGWDDRSVRLWDVELGVELRRFSHPSETLCVAFSPEGETAFSGDKDGIVRSWRLPAPPSEPLAFVRLGGPDAPERKFDTLAEAVRNASDGDTIEVRGNGPFVTKPVDIAGKPLLIRAGRGFEPVIQLEKDELKAGLPLLKTDAALTLEGLELRREFEGLPVFPERTLLVSWGAPLNLSHCRFVTGDYVWAVHNTESSSLEARDCLFAGGSLYWAPAPGGRLLIHNSLIACRFDGVIVHQSQDVAGGASVHFTRNTIYAAGPFRLINARPDEGLETKPGSPTMCEATENIFDGTSLMAVATTRIADLDTALAACPDWLSWRDSRNLYSIRGEYLNVWPDPLESEEQILPAVQGLSEWLAIWEARETGSFEGAPRYRSLRLMNHDLEPPIELREEDFRLLPGSAGSQAGPDGKDLGADVDLVGPGAAYERWKQTPEYQQWLKDTGQVK